MKVILSLGGSVLAPDLDAEQVAAHAAAIESLVDAGFAVGVVVGGGEVARDYITTARELGGNEVELDELGIAATRLNARPPSIPAQIQRRLPITPRPARRSTAGTWRSWAG